MKISIKSTKNKIRKQHPFEISRFSPWKIKNQTFESQNQEDYEGQQTINLRKCSTINKRKPNWKNKEQLQAMQQSSLKKIKKDCIHKKSTNATQFKRYCQDQENIKKDKQNDKDKIIQKYKDNFNCIKFKNLANTKNRKSFKIAQDRQLPILSPKERRHTNVNISDQNGLNDSKFNDSHFLSHQATFQNSPKKDFKTIQPPSIQPLIPHIATLHYQNTITGDYLSNNGFSYVIKDKIIVLKNNKVHLVSKPPLQNILKVKMINNIQNNSYKAKDKFFFSTIDNNIKSTRNCYTGLKISQKSLARQKHNKNSFLYKAYYNKYPSNEQNYDNTSFAEKILIQTARQSISQNKKVVQRNQKIKNMIRNGGRKLSIL